MSLMERSLDGMATLSGQLGAALQRRLREVGGIALLSLAVAAGLALATWSVQDPSLSHATKAPVHNLLGVPGAIAADLLMQLFGLGSLALLLPTRGLGLSADRPSAAQPRAPAHRVVAGRRRARRRVCILSAAYARIGHCHPGSAASSVTPYCGCRQCSCAAAFGIDQTAHHRGHRARHRRAHRLRGRRRHHLARRDRR